MTAGRLMRFSVGFVLGVFAAIVIMVVWFGISGVMLWTDVAGFRASSSAAKEAAVSGDFSAASKAIEEATDQAHGAANILSSAPWSWAQDFPAVGGTVTAAATFASAADSVLSAADGVGPGLTAIGEADSLSSAVDALISVNPHLQLASKAMEASGTEIAAIDTEAVLPFARARVQAEQDRFASLVDPVVSGTASAAFLPDMLGATTPRSWLVVLSQPSEARGSGGGFFGAFTTVTASGGRFAIAQAEANDLVADIQQDLSALPEDYTRLWGPDAQYLWGFNLTRHYPYSAQVAHQAVGKGADYVVSLDPRTVASLLALTGPLTVEGVTLDAANAEWYFARDIYIQYPDPLEKDRVTIGFLNQVFQRLSEVPPAPSAVWQALSPVIEGQHIEVWAVDPAIQEQVAKSPLGAVVPAADTPWVTAAFNNSAGNKIDSYIDSSLQYRVTGSCDAEWVTGEITATLTLEQIPPGMPVYISGRNDLPGAPYGTSSMFVHLYAPMGSLGRDFRVNGVSVPVIQGEDVERKVWGHKVELTPGVPVQFTATFDQKPYKGMPLEIQPQPMVRDTTVTVIDERDCSS